MLLSQIPGYTAAVARAAAQEETLRRRAFLPHTTALCGVPVRAFTPRHFLILDELASPFLTGAIAGPEHVAQFFWVVSPAFLLPSPEVSLRAVDAARTAYIAGVEKEVRGKVRRVGGIATRVRFGPALREIDAYLDAALFDRPSGGKDSTARPDVSFAAALVDEIASNYGWPDEVLDARGQPVWNAGILDKPLARLCQYRRRIWKRDAARLGHDLTLPNRLSDAAARDFLARPSVAARVARSLARQNRGSKPRKGGNP